MYNRLLNRVQFTEGVPFMSVESHKNYILYILEIEDRLYVNEELRRIYN